MVRIAPVNLQFNPKTLWFDAKDFELSAKQGVVVNTARGTEFGHMAQDVFEASDAQVKSLKSPLKPVIRAATEEDEAKAKEMDKLSAEALPIFKQMAAELNADMHPVSVEYLFSGDKAVFYFEAEERVDFRELVRKLAATFHVRIDMRQIGVRDEARMVGGIGHCGQELCCKRLGGEFCPVSIRMAKEQDLSLNPQKISGLCGRLMCCLRYEFDTYKEFKSRAPKHNSQVQTPDGPAKVIDLDVPREVVSLKVEGEKPVKVPLAEFDPPEEGQNRPKVVGTEAWERATGQVDTVSGASLNIDTSQLTGADKLADPTAVRHVGKSDKQKNAGRGSSAQNGHGKNGGRDGRNRTDEEPSRKPRRRRSMKVNGGQEEGTDAREGGRQRRRSGQQRSGADASGTGQQRQKKRTGQGGKTRPAGRPGEESKKREKRSGQGNKQQGPRPGQRSSGLRKDADAASPKHAGEGQHRRTRRRSHKAGGEGEHGSAPGKGTASHPDTSGAGSQNN